MWDLWNQASQAREIIIATQHLRVTELEMRRREKDVMLRSLKVPEFFEIGTSSYIQLHQQELARFKSSIQQLKGTLPEDQHTAIEDLQQAVNTYEQTFQDLLDAYREQGFKNWGLIGRWRAVIHHLEEQLQIVQNLELERKLLLLRRAEKDFLLRNDLTYQQRVFELLRDLKTQIQHVPTIKSTELMPLLHDYEEAFSAYLDLEQKIGQTENEGLRGIFRQAIHAVRPAVIELQTKAMEKEQRAHARLRWGVMFSSILLAVFFMVTVCLGYMIWLRMREMEELYKTQATQVAEYQSQLAAINRAHAVIEFNLDGTIITANKNFLDLLGYRLEEIQGQHHRLFCELDYAASADYQNFWKNLNSGGYDQGVYRRLRKDGQPMWLHANYNPIFDATGQVYKVMKFATDMTHQKELEENLKHREQELIYAITFTQEIVDAAGDGIMTFTEDGIIELFNPAAQSIFGYAKHEVLGQTVSTLIERSLSADQVESNIPLPLGIALTAIGLRKDGDSFPLELSVSKVHVGEHQVFTAIARDVSLQKEIQKELIESRDKAYEAVKIKAEFLAMMSHEIRTPMNGIMGMTDLLIETDLSTEQIEYAETVKRSSHALLTIINDILDFSKIESGKFEIEVIDFDLQSTLEEVLDLIGPKAQEKGLEIVGLVSPSIPTAVRGDPGRFRQILLNLVGNAIKFCHQGEVVVHITVERELTESVFLRVEVRDTGIGISPIACEKLFQPFSQVDGSTTRKYGGTGLGLAICKQLAELMGGEIGVESTHGQGSCFWFTTHLERLLEPVKQESPVSQCLEGLRVCCVDDNDTNRRLLAQYVENWGMRLTSVSSGIDALAVLHGGVSQGQPFDLAILDMHMPNMDGLELAKAIKADPVIQHVRLVLQTSLGRGDTEKAHDNGIEAYLTKPIRKAHLERCLVTLMSDSSTSIIEGGETSESRHTMMKSPRREHHARILVADDHAVNQQLASLFLQRLGYHVEVVSNGKDAIQALQNASFDLILMDCQMPEMDGYEATEKIREMEQSGPEIQESLISDVSRSSRLPIIALTANAMKRDREKCLEAGMDDFLSKPINIKDLEMALTRWIPEKPHVEVAR